MAVTSPVRAASTASSWYVAGTGTINATIPAGVVDGDTIVYVLQGSGHDAAVAPTFTATGAPATQFQQAVYLRNTARNPSGQTLSVWIMQNAPASMSGQTFAVTASQCIYSGQIFVLKGPMWVGVGAPATTGTATSTTINVAKAFDVSAADIGVLSIAACENAVLYSTANINVGAELLLGSGYYQGQANCYSSHHIVTFNNAAPVTYTSDLAVTSTTVQVGLTSTKPRGWDNKAPLAASGSIGGARGTKFIAPTPRAVSAPLQGSLSVPGTVSVNVPAGVQNGDTILLLASAIASGGTNAQLTIAGTGALATFQHLIDVRHPTRGHCLSVFVLRNASAALSGQALTVRGDSTGGTFYYLLQAMILPGSDYILGSGVATSGATASATVTVPDLLAPGMPVQRVLNFAALDTAGGTAYTFTGPAIIVQAQYGSMGHMMSAGPVTGAYTYSTSTGGYQETGQIGLSAIAPRGDANKHPLVGSGAVTARARVKVGAANKHPLAATATLTGRGRKNVTGRTGALSAGSSLTGRAGTKILTPFTIRALGPHTEYYSASYGATTVTIPAGVQTGDTIVVVVSSSGGAAATGWLTQFNEYTVTDQNHVMQVFTRTAVQAADVPAALTFSYAGTLTARVLVIAAPIGVDTLAGPRLEPNGDAFTFPTVSAAPSDVLLSILTASSASGAPVLDFDATGATMITEGVYTRGPSYGYALAWGQTPAVAAMTEVNAHTCIAKTMQIALTATPTAPQGAVKLAASATVTGSGRRASGGAACRAIGSGSITAQGRADIPESHEGTATLTGTAALAAAGKPSAAGQGALQAGGALSGRSGAHGASGQATLTSTTGPVHGEGTAEWTVAMIGNGRLVAGSTIGAGTGVKQMHGRWTLDALGWVNARAAATAKQGQARLTGGSSLTGRADLDRTGHGDLTADSVMHADGRAQHSAGGALGGTAGLSVGPGGHEGHGHGRIDAGGTLFGRSSSDKSGQGELVTSATIGGGHGFQRGGWAAPLVGVGAIRGQRHEPALPCGEGTHADYEEGLPQWLTM